MRVKRITAVSCTSSLNGPKYLISLPVPTVLLIYSVCRKSAKQYDLLFWTVLKRERKRKGKKSPTDQVGKEFNPLFHANHM